MQTTNQEREEQEIMDKMNLQELSYYEVYDIIRCEFIAYYEEHILPTLLAEAEAEAQTQAEVHAHQNDGLFPEHMPPPPPPRLVRQHTIRGVYYEHLREMRANMDDNIHFKCYVCDSYDNLTIQRKYVALLCILKYECKEYHFLMSLTFDYLTFNYIAQRHVFTGSEIQIINTYDIDMKIVKSARGC